MALAYASGKVILFGEHAVVYGRPAVAVPVAEVRAQARIERGADGEGVVIVAPDVGRRVVLHEVVEDDPLAHIVRLVLDAIKVERNPDVTITVTSTIPIARGMGSGAAVSTAIVRALAQYFERWLSSRAISELVYQAEILYHGTPSGIDNTVVAYEKPIYFVKSEGWEIFWVGRPFLLAIADTGIESSTREVVGDLRRRYEAEPARYTPFLDEAGQIAVAARSAIEQGQIETLGRLMDENHAVLQALEVSCPELDCLVVAAREGGALGAKLSGAGRGGNIIALVDEKVRGRVGMMLRLAGATRVLFTVVR
jgi:mevalonate kinase